MASFIGLWAIFIGIIGLNGFAAGIVAVLHGWRSKQQSRRSRTLTAAAVAGLLPVTLVAPTMLVEASVGTRAPAVMLVAIAVIGGLAMAASLPGAMIVARKLDAPGDAFRAFE